MRFPMILFLGFGLTYAQTGPLKLEIPVVKTSVNLDGQAVDVALWGAVSSRNTADLAGLQQNLTPVLRAQLNQSEKCGNRLSVDRAVLVPAAPLADLTPTCITSAMPA